MNITTLLVAAFVSVASTVSLAAAPRSGEPTDAATPAPNSVAATAASGSLTYTGLSGTCDANTFSLSATASATFPGSANVAGSTTLNGNPYDTFTFSLGSPSTFATSFGRTFSPALPSNTYTFVFNSAVTYGGILQGTSVTTITCTAGVLTATNAWVAAPTPSVPTMSDGALWALALLLAGAVAWRARRAQPKLNR
jgi:hypothetical protein